MVIQDSQHVEVKSLSAQVAEWRQLEREKILIPAIDPTTKQSCEIEAPAWLFRGERAKFPEAYAGIHRLSSSGLSTLAQEEVRAVTRRLDSVLQKFGLHPMYSAALLQHYSFPTELLDLTASLDAAAAFAAHNNGGAVGLLMAFPTKNLQKNGIIVDLKGIDFARRPRHQNAYVWFHQTQLNLKDAALSELLEPQILFFQGTSKDLQRSEEYYQQICGAPHTDPTSGLLNKLLEEFVLVGEHGKKLSISDEARDWLEEIIPWAPVPMRVSSDDPDVMEPAWDEF